MKILIIEDRSAIRTVFHSLIKRDGYEMLGAATFNEGFELAQQHKPNAIFIDMEVADVEEGLGPKALALLRATQETWFPITAMSMDYKPEEYLSLIQAGADDALFKPIDPNILKGKLLAVERIISSMASESTSSTNNQD